MLLLLPLAIGAAALCGQKARAALRSLPLQGMPPQQRRGGGTMQRSVLRQRRGTLPMPVCVLGVAMRRTLLRRGMRQGGWRARRLQVRRGGWRARRLRVQRKLTQDAAQPR